MVYFKYKVGILMKKYLKLSFLVVLSIFLCTGCDGDVTRALRHEGFDVGNSDFICEAFFGETPAETVRYFTGTKIITDSGRIYEVSMGQKYSNDANCKVADTDLKVASVFDYKIFRAENGNLYTLDGENNTSAYTQLTDADNNFVIYKLLLHDGVVKAMTADSSSGIYYVLRTDGNVYGYTISKGDRNTEPSIVGTVIVYDSSLYGGPIVDFGYYGNSSSTYVRTDTKFFRMKATNYDECSKFADIPCDYSMVESTTLEENAKYLLAYNGSTIITTYKKVFTVKG